MPFWRALSAAAHTAGGTTPEDPTRVPSTSIPISLIKTLAPPALPSPAGNLSRAEPHTLSYFDAVGVDGFAVREAGTIVRAFQVLGDPLLQARGRDRFVRAHVFDLAEAGHAKLKIDPVMLHLLPVGRRCA